MTNLIALYEWSDPQEVIDTVSGKIPVMEWLEQERHRIMMTPGRTAKIRWDGEMVTLMVNDIGDHQPQHTDLRQKKGTI